MSVLPTTLAELAHSTNRPIEELLNLADGLGLPSSSADSTRSAAEILAILSHLRRKVHQSAPTAEDVCRDETLANTVNATDDTSCTDVDFSHYSVKVAELTVRTEQLELRLLETESEKQSATEEARQLSARNEILGNTLRDLRRQHEAQTTELQGLQTCLSRLSDQAADIKQLKAANRALQREADDARRVADAERRALNASAATLKRELHLARTELSEVQNRFSRLQAMRRSERRKRRAEEFDMNRARPALAAVDLSELPNVQNWIRKCREPFRTVFEGEDIVLIGTSPIPYSTFRRRLEARGCTLHDPGSPEAGILIIGREHWTIDEIEDQIKARSGETLRIYSQEIALLAMEYGQDPIDTAPRRLLTLMAGDHPALRCCREEGFFWPTVNTSAISATISQSWDDRAEQSPLKRLGYTVGRVNGLAPGIRREQLLRAFQRDLPYVQSKAYMRSWGSPSSRRRLRRMAHFLAWLARGARAKSAGGTNMREAIEDWNADLRWLQANCYEPWMCFRWPEPVVPVVSDRPDRLRRKRSRLHRLR